MSKTRQLLEVNNKNTRLKSMEVCSATLMLTLNEYLPTEIINCSWLIVVKVVNS